MKPLTVLFFGSQGAGKGTQVQMLIDYLESKSDSGVIRIDMGQELRNLRDTGTYAGKLTGEIIDAGFAYMISWQSISKPNCSSIILQVDSILLQMDWRAVKTRHEGSMT